MQKPSQRDQSSLLDTPQQNQQPPVPQNRSQQHDDMMIDEFALTHDLQEQDDPIAVEEERMRAEENIYNTHLDAVKEEVQLIQREGEMITTLEKAIKNEQEYDMRDYLDSARSIAMQKIQMYQQLLQNIDEFQTTFIQK